MPKVLQVPSAAAATAYLAANSEIGCCFYLTPYTYTDLDGNVHTGEENQGYTPTRVYVTR
jgi:hypothetical protein